MQCLRNFLINFSSLILSAGAYPAPAQDKTATFLENLLRDHASPRQKRILDNPDSFRCLIRYTRIDRDSRNRLIFTTIISGSIPLNISILPGDGILDDDKYEYEDTGYPFFKEEYYLSV